MLAVVVWSAGSFSGIVYAETCVDQYGGIYEADVCPSRTYGSGGGVDTTYGSGKGGDVTYGSSMSSIKTFNPLGESSLYGIANAILDILMVFAVPIILFFIVWAGFLYVTAGGKEDQITKATKALMYAVIGGVIILGAKVLLEVITNTVNVFGN